MGLEVDTARQQRTAQLNHYKAFQNVCEHLLTQKPLRHNAEIYLQTHNGVVLKVFFILPYKDEEHLLVFNFVSTQLRFEV